MYKKMKNKERKAWVDGGGGKGGKKNILREQFDREMNVNNLLIPRVHLNCVLSFQTLLYSFSQIFTGSISTFTLEFEHETHKMHSISSCATSQH